MEEEKPQKNLQKIKFFKIPKVDTGLTQSTLIGVFDSSYSMSGQWPFLADMWNEFTQNQEDKQLVVFSSSSNEIPDCKVLTRSIENYFPGGTDITSGFLKLNEVFKKSGNLENVTVLFVSDGAGSFNIDQITQTLVGNMKINFLTVGVGSGFPTKIAMSLRNLYHNGEVNIPPLFLIDEPNKTECWSQNFAQLSTFLSHKSKITLKSAIKPFPWSELTEQIYENSWVISEEIDTLSDVDGKFEIKALEELGITEIIEILKQWLGELQLRSLREKSVLDDAKQAYSIVQEMKIIVDELMKRKEPKRKLTFHEKMLKKVKSDIFQDFHVLAKEIKALSETNILNDISEQEAAKRLAIGTQLGKYHSNALKIRGLSVEQFQEAQSNFVQIFGSVKLSEETEQEPSIISQCTQKDVLLEENFIEGIKLCDSQYSLVETLPLVGQAIKIRRTDGSMINPYLITVEDMARHHKVVDTVSIQGTENNQLVLKTGDGEEEIINAVIPLYTEKDADLKKIIRSKLFQILMTFNVMSNADTCFENAYIALQANTLLYLINQTKSSWRDNMIESLLTTLNVTYGDQENFKFHNQAVLDTPRTAVITEHPDIKTKCEDLSKTILHLFFHTKVNKLQSKEKITEILEAIFCEIFGRFYPNETDIRTFFKMKDPNIVEKLDFTEYVVDATKDFPELMSFYCFQDIKDELNKRLQDLEIKPKDGFDFSVELDMEKLYFLKQGKFSLEKLRKIEEFFLGGFENFESLLTTENFIVWLNHATIRNSKDRNTSEIQKDHQEVLNILQKQKEAELLSKQTVFDLAIKNLEIDYKKLMNETHRLFMPFNENILKEQLQKLNIETSPETYIIQQTSFLISNACCAPDCPYFLKQDKRLSSHRQSVDEIVAFCKTVHLKKDEEDLNAIFQAIINEDCTDKMVRPVHLTEQNKQEMLDNKDKFIKIIQQMREFYRKI